MKTEDFHQGHRQRMRKRVEAGNAAALEDHEVLEMLLFYAIPRMNTNLLAHRLLKTFGSLNGVLDADLETLKAVDGIGDRSAILIKIASDIVRRYKKGEIERPVYRVHDSKSAGAYFLPKFVNCGVETLYMLCLDAGLKVIDCRMVGQGNATCVSVDRRKMVREALDLNASYVVLAHNHTTGIALPSKEDVEVTLQIKRLMADVQVTLVDHLVVAGDDFVSMADSGDLTGY